MQSTDRAAWDKFNCVFHAIFSTCQSEGLLDPVEIKILLYKTTANCGSIANFTDMLRFLF